VSLPWHRLPWRVFTGTAGLVLILLASVLGVASVGARRAARNSARQSLEQSADLVAQLLAGRGRSLGGGARVFVQGPYFRTLVAERRRDDILDQAFEAVEQLEASWVFITDDGGHLIAKSDEPSAFGEPMARVPLVSAALRGQSSTGFGASGDSVLFQATAVPIMAPGGMPFGVLVATRVLDSLTAADIALATDQALLFFVLDDQGRPRAVATSLAGDTALRHAVVRAVATTPATGTSAHREVVHARRTWMLHRSMLATAGGTPVGGYVVLQASDEALASLGPVRASLFLAAVIGLLGAFLAAGLTSRAVARPISALTTQVVELVAHGWAPDARTEPERRRALHASTEVRALTDAINALVVEANDQDTVRAVLAALPVTDADRLHHGRVGARTLAFRHVAHRGTAWRPGMLVAQRYRLDAELGRGEAGAVFRAWDIARRAVVALRLLRANGFDGAGLVHRPAGSAAAEARGFPRVDHRHVVGVVDVGEAEGIRFVSLEFVDGMSLADLLSRHGAMEASPVAAVARQLLRGLAALHSAGVTHGRVTSRRVLVSRAGVVKLDITGAGDGVRRVNRAGQSSRDLGGARVGAAEYMAPESLIGGANGPAADIYSTGVVLYECLTGRTPFASQSPLDLLGSKLAGPPSPSGIASGASGDLHADRPAEEARPSAPSLPGPSPRHAELLALVQRMIHPDPARRVGAAAEALEAWVRVGRIGAVTR